MVSYISSLEKASSLSHKQRKLVLLGSTGSIGKSVLDVVAQHEEKFKIIALGAGKNIKLLAEQIKRFKPEYVGVLSEELIDPLKRSLSLDQRISFVWGEKGYEELASLEEADIVINAISGTAGLKPLVASLKKGKIVALANKESLVLAGQIIKDLCKRYKAEILPIDSEHNAIFQCLIGHNFDEVLNLWLTASGGPFWDKDQDFLSTVTPEMALKHPNWEMGKKITIDSATMMNKALEIIEAYYLFGVDLSCIKVVIHPQSIVHSLVEFIDGTFMAHMAVPDMKIPISFCLFYPKRLSLNIRPLDLYAIKNLEFHLPDHNRFPSIKFAKMALKMGADYPIVLNSANEVAVEMFLNKKISFLKIFELIKRALEEHKSRKVEDIEDVLEIDRTTRQKVMKWLA